MQPRHEYLGHWSPGQGGSGEGHFDMCGWDLRDTHPAESHSDGCGFFPAQLHKIHCRTQWCTRWLYFHTNPGALSGTEVESVHFHRLTPSKSFTFSLKVHTVRFTMQFQDWSFWTNKFDWLLDWLIETMIGIVQWSHCGSIYFFSCDLRRWKWRIFQLLWWLISGTIWSVSSASRHEDFAVAHGAAQFERADTLPGPRKTSQRQLGPLSRLAVASRPCHCQETNDSIWWTGRVRSQRRLSSRQHFCHGKNVAKIQKENGNLVGLAHVWQ